MNIADYVDSIGVAPSIILFLTGLFSILLIIIIADNYDK